MPTEIWKLDLGDNDFRPVQLKFQLNRIVSDWQKKYRCEPIMRLECGINAHDFFYQDTNLRVKFTDYILVHGIVMHLTRDWSIDSDTVVLSLCA